jgi:hypothetical protein
MTKRMVQADPAAVAAYIDAAPEPAGSRLRARDVPAACDRFPRCTDALLGTETGFSVVYGHVDTVLGRPALSEVYPLIEGFLAEQRDAAVSTEAAR